MQMSFRLRFSGSERLTRVCAEGLMPSLVPLVPSNNQQLECNEGKLGEIEVIWRIMGYHDKTQSAGLRRVRNVEMLWHQTGLCVDVSVHVKATKLFKAALNSMAAWGVQ